MTYQKGSRSEAIAKWSLVTAIASLAIIASPGGSQAAVGGDLFSDMRPMSEETLQDARGGLKIGDMEFDIGMMVRAEISKAMADSGLQNFWVETHLTFNDRGNIASSTTTTSDTAASSAAPPSTQPRNVTLSGLQDRIIQSITSNGVVTQLQTDGNGSHSKVTVDLNLALTNHSKILQDLPRNLQTLRNLRGRVDLSSLN